MEKTNKTTFEKERFVFAPSITEKDKFIARRNDNVMVTLEEATSDYVSIVMKKRLRSMFCDMLGVNVPHLKFSLAFIPAGEEVVMPKDHTQIVATITDFENRTISNDMGDMEGEFNMGDNIADWVDNIVSEIQGLLNAMAENVHMKLLIEIERY